MRVATDRPMVPGRVPASVSPDVPSMPDAAGSPTDRWRLVWLTALGACAVCMASLALSTRTGMWLDEAQTLSISRLGVGELLDALRTDGAPPLYYLLLHAWMALVGTSELAARSLSAVFAVAAVALVPLAGHHLGGRRVAITSALLLGSAPFVHRYATEARMYTLVILLTVAGFLALRASAVQDQDQGEDRASPAALAAVGAVTGLLLLTHYWTLFLLAVVGAAMLRARAYRVVAAMAVGSLLFLPWVPSFVHQLRHTGAPWGSAAGAWIFEATLGAFAGGAGQVGLLGFLYLGLAALGLLGRPLDGGRIELDLAGRPGARPLAVAVAATLGLALVASRLTDSAFAPRYAAVVLLPFVLLVARGVSVVEHRRVFPLLVAAVVGMGLARSVHEATGTRTQARRLAAVLEARARPGDLVAFCPDQLAPAVVRLLPERKTNSVTTAAFPPGGPVERVDWVDYRDRVRATTGAEFAADLHRQAGGSQVWLAWAPGYHNLGRRCEAVLQGLRSLRPTGTRQQSRDLSAYENASLWRFPPATP